MIKEKDLQKISDTFCTKKDINEVKEIVRQMKIMLQGILEKLKSLY